MTNFTEDFRNDLFNFARKYNDEIVSSIVYHAEDIYENEMLVSMLHELNERETKDINRFHIRFDYALQHSDENQYHTSEIEIDREDFLAHARSYRDICQDLIWKIIER